MVMTSRRGADLVLAAARRHHLAQVNAVLRRPGMYGGSEVAERLSLESMAAVDDCLTRWQAEFEWLRERGSFAPTGVVGAYRTVLPQESLRDATASVYAEIAHRLGWLHVDRVLSDAEFQQMSMDLDAWVTQDRTLPDVIEMWGPPWLWIGGTNVFYPKTLAYAAADPDLGLICFHQWNVVAAIEPVKELRGVHPEPTLLAVRHRPGTFADSFSFTPEGLRRKQGDVRHDHTAG
ncbi:hypothetical protein [Micromonospora sp. WMMD1155]|uniref:hypothetical protein n=1 Tax=Micromonospora sp. WMMD1155 TaxID=3016094 RepID=UPI00249C6A79|nr:hypothetical protein [Micromonospora sp. WMMD1155]WFE53411.1 hypothetical protein O7617_25185 [Micromonospora sp. WMMD1155]